MALRKKKSIPNDIRLYRHRQNLRIVQVAKLADVTDAALVSHWENGRKIPTLKNALRLSAIIQCPIEVLYLDLFQACRREISARKDQIPKTKR